MATGADHGCMALRLVLVVKNQRRRAAAPPGAGVMCSGIARGTSRRSPGRPPGHGCRRSPPRRRPRWRPPRSLSRSRRVLASSVLKTNRSRRRRWAVRGSGSWAGASRAEQLTPQGARRLPVPLGRRRGTGRESRPQPPGGIVPRSKVSEGDCSPRRRPRPLAPTTWPPPSHRQTPPSTSRNSAPGGPVLAPPSPGTAPSPPPPGP